MADETSILDAASAGNDISESYIDKYVGEGKKYKSVDDLAKAYANADNFITTLKNEQNDMKEFIRTQFQERAKEKTEITPPSQETQQQTSEPRQQPSNVERKEDKVDLKAQIKELLDAEREEDSKARNSRVTEAAMLDKFGTKEAALDAIKLKAAEMGVGPQFIANMAFTTPAAFFKIMDIDAKSTSTPSPRSDVNTVNIQATGTARPNTYAWYENLRKTDRKKYMSPAVQNALMKDAMEKGDDFYKR
jgi:hypothetical protein